MKKFTLLLACGLVLAACNSQLSEKTNEGEPSNAVSNEENGQYANFQSVVPAEWNVQLPTNYPVAENQYLTAKTTVTEQEVQYDFYQFDDKVELDASNVTEGEYVGQLIVTRYAHESTANDALTIELTKNSNAVTDVGSEPIYPFIQGDESVVNWVNSANWYMFVYSREQSEQELIEWVRTKDLVNDTTNGDYPKPQIIGQMHFYADDEIRTFVTWTEKEMVFTLKEFGGTTLEWLHAFH